MTPIWEKELGPWAPALAGFILAAQIIWSVLFD